MTTNNHWNNSYEQIFKASCYFKIFKEKTWITNKSDKYSNSKKYYTDKYRMKLVQGIKKWFNGFCKEKPAQQIIAASTFFALVTATILFIETKEQVEISKEALIDERRATDAQINSLEVENRPFLQINEIYTDTSGTIILQIMNYGNFPGYLSSGDYGAFVSSENLSADEINKHPTTISKSYKFIINNALANPPVRIERNDISGKFEAYKKGLSDIYVFGNIVYQSLTTKKYFRCSFCYKLHQNFQAPTSPYVDIIDSRIEDVKQ